jgi:hypothetical protein
MKTTYVNVAAHSGAVTASLEANESQPAGSPGANHIPALYTLVEYALNIKGRVTYTLVVEDGKLVQLAQANGSADTGAESTSRLTMKQAAEIMRHSYDWLSRNYKRLGLHPTSYGYPLLFDAREIEDCMKRHIKNYRGRPRKNLDAGRRQS